MNGMNSTEKLTVEEIKAKLEEYFGKLPAYYKMLFEQDKIIRDTQSNQFNTITQNGFTYFESRDITHFIAPTNILVRTVEPHEYEHKVLVYSERTNLFNTVYTGLSHKCMEYVFRWQEAKYGFSYKIRNQALKGLQEIKQYFDWTGDILSEDYNKQSEDRIKAIIAQAKLDTGFVDDDSVPEVRLEDVKNDALVRSEVRKARREEFERSLKGD